MQGRQFLDVARPLAARSSEAFWRAAAIHAYYALFLESRDLLAGWGRRPPTRQNVHTWVRHQFVFSRDAELRRIGFSLDSMCTKRNVASYDMGHSLRFSSDRVASDMILESQQGIDTLDVIDRSPARRAVAIAALPT